MTTFEDDLRLIVQTHNEVRNLLYSTSSPKAHMINENTVLRLQVLLEAWDCDAPTGTLAPGASNGEIAARTLKYLRNLISHKEHGLFLELTGSPQWPAIQAFARNHPEIRVAIGAPLCLAADAVLQPLVDGLLQWAAEGGQTQLGAK